MKLFISGILIFVASFAANAQSTCLSRCESHLGVGHSDCPDICKGFPEKGKRKKKDGDVAAVSASASASASSVASASTPKKEPAELKDAKAAFESGQAAGK